VNDCFDVFRKEVKGVLNTVRSWYGGCCWNCNCCFKNK